MTLRVSGKNMDVGEALRTRAETQIDTTARKYFDGGYNGHLTLEPEGFGFHAMASMHLDSGPVLQVEGFGGDAISAFEELSLNLEKRLRRYNRKLKAHRRPAASGTGEDTLTAQSYVLAGDGGDDELDEDYSPPVIAEATSTLRRMSVGEAVMELDLGQQDIVMFRHAGHGGLNVVYGRADGNIGWIDPALSSD